MLDIARRAARAAFDQVRRHLAPAVTRKGAVDLVTELDLAAEQAIREVLGAATPDIPILAEEGGGAFDTATRWLVDPLDGTTNFVHGFPFYCVSIALELDGRLECGVVHDLVHDRVYHARRGGGAWLDDERLTVSGCDELDGALLASGFAYDRRRHAAAYLRFVQRALERSQGFRRTGSAALDLAHVASGRLDGYWEFNLKPWDVAAGALLVTEAGGRISDLRGAPINLDRAQVVATNGHFHDELLAAFADLRDSAPGPHPKTGTP